MSNEIRDLLESVKEGTVSVEDALKEIKLQPYEIGRASCRERV